MGAEDVRTAPASAPGTLRVHQVASRVADAVGQVIDGKTDAVRLATIVLLTGGHLLIEDVPGVGKTMLAKALAKASGTTARRIQFTPDLLPTDVTGVSVYDQGAGDFQFRPGAVFANIVIGDEINRASPKTQSALLECMEERQVTVDAVTYPLASPFMVVATQNPVEMEGTYPLPEAQRDRFMVRLSLGYPDEQAEARMLDNHGTRDPLDDLAAVTDADELTRATAVVRGVYVSDPVRAYVVALAAASRRHPDLRLGASPRAALHLLRIAKTAAACDGRDFVLPDDIRDLAVAVLAHRLLLTPDAQFAQRRPQDIVADLLSQVPVPPPGSVGREPPGRSPGNPPARGRSGRGG